MLFLTALLLACPGISHELPDGVSTVTGKIEKIRFQNINKARGHFTYNVDLTLTEADIKPLPEGWKKTDRVTVRIHQSLPWSKFTREEQGTLTPDVPRHTMETPRWRMFEVGKRAEIHGRPTGQSLFHIIEEPSADAALMLRPGESRHQQKAIKKTVKKRR